jgi:hypothetical protein
MHLRRRTRRTRYRRLAAAACGIYGLTIWLYPREFRRAFGRELAITFRSRVEDVLETGGLRDWFAFVAHMAWDMISTYRMLLSPGEVPGDAVSLLGLSEGEIALGGLHRAPLDLDIQLMFATAGVVLAFAGWFVFLVILPKYIC